MQVHHPRAGDGPGTAPAAVDVDGERRPVNEDGVFEGGDEAWLTRFADRYDADPDALRVGDDDLDGESGTLPFSPDAFTVGEIEDRIADIDDAATVRALRNLEEEQQDRTTAIDALDARLDELEE